MKKIIDNFVDCVKNKYVQLSGRAPVEEYWQFFLVVFVVQMVLNLLARVSLLFNVLSIIVSLAIFCPYLGVSVRRMHDVGKSGWYLLIALIPLVGWILLLVALCKSSAPDNAYGPCPVPNRGWQAPNQNGNWQAPNQNGNWQAPNQNGGWQAPNQNGGWQAPNQNGSWQAPNQNGSWQAPNQNGGGQANQGGNTWINGKENADKPAGEVPQPQAAFCPNCGSKLTPGAAFCPGCGSRVS